MKFKNIKISTLLLNILVAAAYPLLKTYISSSNRMLIFTDCLTIMSFIMIVLGIFYSFYLKGDFDVTSYVMNRSVNKGTKPVQAYLADSKKTREESFNYPLFVGLLFLLTSLILCNTQF